MADRRPSKRWTFLSWLAKTMRWAHHRTRFARPIRWVVALVGGAVAPFTLDAVQSGSQSRGHRFNHPEPFTVTRPPG